ncbi:dockerin type I domain-containing protein [Aeoliella sp. ICT_H6.2]|uniref:Dockerin type I domain-containing protein n=1 Tax=Aeoliella straminimaris TaxID=2954799 RepID=A0A9X2FC86_9BACT|nr:dockerin type I domain-containing protein [Aeoliella straminimaris]MCO6045573.1 dockerin type I domain-containing protein [Aeoliella straminimaris]
MFTSYISLGGWVRALLEVDLASGQLQLLTGIRIHKGGIAALGIDDTGALFALSSIYEDGVGVVDSVSQVDKSNGEFLWSRSLSQNVSVSGAASMDFDPDTNQMYVAATPGYGIPPSLYTINVHTGNVIEIGSESEFIYPMSLVILPSTPLPGDFNNDGTVDLADYTVWRNNLGATGTGLAADGNGDSVVDAADYGVWKEHFGQSTGAVGEVSTVPEPGTALQWGVLALAVVGAKTVTRRRRRG